MRIAIGSDHAGFESKEGLLKELRKHNEVTDCGTTGNEPVDYPDFAASVAEAVASGKAERGILICGTGIGMCMAANKHTGIRAAACHNPETARLSRKHNDANVLCLGSRILSIESMIRIADVWLKTGFEGGRHAARIDKMKALEGCV